MGPRTRCQSWLEWESRQTRERQLHLLEDRLCTRQRRAGARLLLPKVRRLLPRLPITLKILSAARGLSDASFGTHDQLVSVLVGWTDLNTTNEDGRARLRIAVTADTAV